MKLLSIMALCASIGLCAMEPAGEPVVQGADNGRVQTLTRLAADALYSEKFLDVYREKRESYQEAMSHLPGEVYTVLRRRPILWKLLPVTKSILVGHDNRVTSVVYGPDGQLTTASRDNTIKIWDTQTSKENRTLAGHEGAVRSVAYGPDGLLASGSNDRTIKIWNPATGKEIRTLAGHKGAVISVAYGPDGQLFSGSADGTVKIWDVSTGSKIRTLKGHLSWVSSVAYSLNRQLASGSHDETIKFWDPRAGTLITSLEGHAKAVTSLAYSSKGQLASGSHDHTVKIWDSSMGASLNTLTGHIKGVISVTYGPDEQLASCSKDTTIKIWDSHAGKCIKTLTRDDAHTAKVTGTLLSTLQELNTVLEADDDRPISVAYGPEGQLASGLDDGRVKIWSPLAGISNSKELFEALVKDKKQDKNCLIL